MAHIVNRGDITAPCSNATSVVPDDDNDLTYASRAIYVGNSGNLKVTMIDGNAVTFINLPAGWHPIGVKRVWSTGTTANNIIAAW